MKKESYYEFEENKYFGSEIDVSVLVGQVIKSISSSKYEIIIETENFTYKMYHEQDCCESVEIESIVGDIQDLVGQKILQAEERVSYDEEQQNEDDYNSNTWTFYCIRCAKTSIDIRWHGESNGYYSESVDFVRIK